MEEKLQCKPDGCGQILIKLVAWILFGFVNKNLESAIKGESWRIREAEWPASRVLTSTNAQTKGAILFWDCILRLTAQPALSSCLLLIFLSLPVHITPVSPSLVLGLKVWDHICVRSVSQTGSVSCSPWWPWTHRDLSASVSWVLSAVVKGVYHYCLPSMAN